MCTSDGYPYKSAIDVLKRRATAPVSNSASTTTRPETMCSPPAKRSNAAISDRLQQGLGTSTRLSSSFTPAVIAIVMSPRGRLVRTCLTSGAQERHQRLSQSDRIVSGGPVLHGDLGLRHWAPSDCAA